MILLLMGQGAVAQAQPASALVAEAESGYLLIKDNVHEELPPASLAKVMTLYLTFGALEKGRPIALTPEILIVNNFYFNTDKGSYDFNYDGGLIRLVFPTSSLYHLMTTELTLFFDTFKFHGYCYSVDKFQKLTRTCGLIDLANNFKI